MDTVGLTAEETQRRDELANRLFQSTLGALELVAVYIGDRLGLYRAVAEAGRLTAAGLAARAGIHARYAREWLEQQAVAGILQVDDVGADAEVRRYSLGAGYAEALLDRDSLSYIAPITRFLAAIGGALPDLLQAYREGRGVSWDRFGADGRDAQAAFNRPAYLKLLGQEWLPAVQDVHARLQADPPARVAEIGCGGGWASIGIALAYPKARVDGFDLDAPSIEMAKENARDSGVADRVTFQVRDAADPSLAGEYDLALAFECLHDMSRPVEALATMRKLVGERGTAIIMDERVAEQFTAPGDDVERLMYGFSLVACLPNGMAEQPSAATGTVMRPDTLRRYATQAGFSDVEILPIEHDLFRFYRLVPKG